MPHEIKIGLAFCTPHPYVRNAIGQLMPDTISWQWHKCRAGLSTPTNINLIEMHAEGMEIGEARDSVAKKVLEHKPVPEFVFFLDNDVLPAFDALTKLWHQARYYPKHELFAGVYCCKWMSPPDPLIYAGDGVGPYLDWTVGDILTTEQHGITSVHMGLTLIRTSLFRRMLDAGEDPLFKSVNEKDMAADGGVTSRRGTEDIYFCANATGKHGAKILVDTSVLAGHIDKGTGKIYGLDWGSMPVKRAKALYDKSADYVNAKKALDIGAGTHRREWPGYRTYTLDMRKDTNPDYCQDSRKLNLPKDHFDLVASSHHLEHIGRWEQEAVWKQMFDILKPGGKVEHIVPDITWALEAINDEALADQAFNVLYGAQEAHGYAREMNTHYFGYTPEIARSLAEESGLVRVRVKSRKDDPKLGYNLIVTGVKPKAKKAKSNGKRVSR